MIFYSLMKFTEDIMVFSSTIFLFFFLPITLFVYFCLKDKYRNYWLILASSLFFAWQQPNYWFIILLSIAINYFGAILLEWFPRRRKWLFFLVVAANLGLLFYYKYFDFTISTLNHLFHAGITLKEIVLPIGISFFTFQGMSYTIDVFRGKVCAQKNPFHVALYIMLFPQLVAGPIVRYTDIAAELHKRATHLDDLTEGVQRFIIGLGKKTILANTLAQMVDDIWNQGAGTHVWYVAWLGSIAYTLQIYFDFSGYSDMAIGLGRILGFHFPENFNLPYISKNISEFWRKWHMSLSSWFRDYVYIPLGGNRRHVYFNLAVVFLLTGIWHGASWHFVFWGVWNGFFILLERLLKINKKEYHAKWQLVLSKLCTLFIVNIGWIFFRADTMADAVLYLKSMFGLSSPGRTGYTIWWYMNREMLFVLLLGIFFSTAIPGKIAGKIRSLAGKGIFLQGITYVGMIFILYYSMIKIVAGTYNPFIYFQF